MTVGFNTEGTEDGARRTRRGVIRVACPGILEEAEGTKLRAEGREGMGRASVGAVELGGAAVDGLAVDVKAAGAVEVEGAGIVC